MVRHWKGSYPLSLHYIISVPPNRKIVHTVPCIHYFTFLFATVPHPWTIHSSLYPPNWRTSFFVRRRSHELPFACWQRAAYIARYFRVGLARQQKGGSNERGEKLILWPTLILSYSFASVNRFFQVFNSNRNSFIIASLAHSFPFHWFRTAHKANTILTPHIPCFLPFFASVLLRFSAKIRQALNTQLSFPSVR